MVGMGQNNCNMHYHFKRGRMESKYQPLVYSYSKSLWTGTPTLAQKMCLN